jgi:uncharacterized protein (TIGR02118 family)
VIKVVIIFRRRPGMSVADFREHWRSRHAPIIARLPGLRRYVQNTPVDAAPPFDAVAESSFDDTQAMKDLARAPVYAEVLADEPRFIDRASLASLVTEERVLKDGPAGGAKRITFVKRDAQVPVDAFFQRWLEDGRQFAADPAVRRYAQCCCRRAIYDSGRTPAYDGADMAWLEPGAAAPAGAASLAVAERVVL